MILQRVKSRDMQKNVITTYLKGLGEHLHAVPPSNNIKWRLVYKNSSEQVQHLTYCDYITINVSDTDLCRLLFS